MFGLFKRTKFYDWEIDLLRKVVTMLPDKYKTPWERQIKEGLYNGVIIAGSDIPGYVAFSLNKVVYGKFYDQNGRNFRLENILVFDRLSNQYLPFAVYSFFGFINGYSLEKRKKYALDLNRIDVTGMKMSYYDSVDYERIEPVLKASEKKLISRAGVYIVELEGKEFFHLIDLDDGDFIGIDLKKNIYKITHDPYQITLLDEDLEVIFKKRSINL